MQPTEEVEKGSPQYIAELTARFINLQQKKRQRHTQLEGSLKAALEKHLLSIDDDEAFSPRSVKAMNKFQIISHICDYELDAQLDPLIDQLEELGVNTERLRQNQLFGAVL